MKKVLVVQRRMTAYRVPFFEALRDCLAVQGIELAVAYGDPTVEELSKNDGAELSWGIKLDTKYFLGSRICFQPLRSIGDDKDMIVLTPENKLICNLWHQYFNMRCRIGLWGHGENLQGDRRSFRERFKRIVARQADWWFGYTEISRSIILKNGFVDDRITIVNNSVDIVELKRYSDNISSKDVAEWRHSHGIGAGPVGVFLGSLYKEKRIDFLLRAAKNVRLLISGFELVIIGDGPLRSEIELFCEENDWVHYLRARKGFEKVLALRGSDVLLSPGAVGLGILDSFACSIPLVTTDCGNHGPEIAYINNGINGVVSKNSQESFVTEVAGLLKSRDALNRLVLGCAASSELYSIENMSRNFSIGIADCLAAPISRGVC
jgi:glycosyltransferase involved in cell wall biosynthesis